MTFASACARSRSGPCSSPRFGKAADAARAYHDKFASTAKTFIQQSGTGPGAITGGVTNIQNILDAAAVLAVVTCGITFTFGGLKIDTDGRVLDLAKAASKTPLDTLKTWQRFKVADQAGPYLSKRFVDSQFELPMAKQLIAGHLSIQPETFSRIIRRLIDEKIGANFARVVAGHRSVVETYPSYQVARLLKLVPLKGLWRPALKAVG